VRENTPMWRRQLSEKKSSQDEESTRRSSIEQVDVSTSDDEEEQSALTLDQRLKLLKIDEESVEEDLKQIEEYKQSIKKLGTEIIAQTAKLDAKEYGNDSD
jgi:predicted nucleotide-binding protein (sugar kinase/HSP70/actin superfamily)